MLGRIPLMHPDLAGLVSLKTWHNRRTSLKIFVAHHTMLQQFAGFSACCNPFTIHILPAISCCSNLLGSPLAATHSIPIRLLHFMMLTFQRVLDFEFC